MKLFGIFIFLALVVVPAAAFAQAQNTPEQVNENWTYVEAIDPLTDADVSVVFSPEINPESQGRSVAAQNYGSLVITCGPKNYGLFLQAGVFMRSEGVSPVRYRLDGGVVSTPRSWIVANTGTAMYAPEFAVGEIVEELHDAEQMLIRTSDYRDVSYDYTFNVGGLEEALSRLSCYSTF